MLAFPQKNKDRKTHTNKTIKNKKGEKKRKTELRVGTERTRERKQSQREKTITYVEKQDRRETSYFPVS